MNITNFLSVDVVTAIAGLATGIGASGVVSWLLNRYDRRRSERTGKGKTGR